MDEMYSMRKKAALINRAVDSGRSGVVWRWNLLCLRRAMATVHHEIPRETLPLTAFAALERWIEGGVAVRTSTFERHAESLLPGRGTPYLKRPNREHAAQTGDGSHFVIIGLSRACGSAAKHDAGNPYISDECAIAAEHAVPASGMENAGDGEAEGCWQLETLQAMLAPRPLPRAPRIGIEDSLALRRR